MESKEKDEKSNESLRCEDLIVVRNKHVKEYTWVALMKSKQGCNELRVQYSDRFTGKALSLVDVLLDAGWVQVAHKKKKVMVQSPDGDYELNVNEICIEKIGALITLRDNG